MLNHPPPGRPRLGGCAAVAMMLVQFRIRGSVMVVWPAESNVDHCYSADNYDGETCLVSQGNQPKCLHLSCQYDHCVCASMMR